MDQVSASMSKTHGEAAGVRKVDLISVKDILKNIFTEGLPYLLLVFLINFCMNFLYLHYDCI